ncbi:MAG: riboflavin synthase [Actinomycetia bacterium]|nr:riboflavin synthase [Actinomycetes bacterium]
MFTGIVTEVGRVVGYEPTDRGRRLKVEAPQTTADLKVGDSVAVNGICMTAVVIDPPGFGVEAMAETLARTNLGGLNEGSLVNLERPMQMGGRLDGHIVQGHIDAAGMIVAIEPEGRSKRVTISIPDGLERYLVYKGSVAVDGVALTVTGVETGRFEVALIPHTLEATTLRDLEVGDTANVEVDILAKYVERLLVFSK